MTSFYKVFLEFSVEIHIFIRDTILVASNNLAVQNT
jgi:hypothetical protein